jgi:molybdenum cofactor cytidylyltransferase
MIPLEQTVAILLCAGLSRRYAPGNKLLALFDGKPLAMHAAELCATTAFAGRAAVVPPAEPRLHALLSDLGFRLVVNPDPASGKDSSLRLGLAVALDLGARGVLVLLGDMPHVTAAHFRALSAAAGEGLAVISTDGAILSPPTLISAETARQILADDDRPVRACLGRPIAVTAPTSMLADYDYPEQFVAPER